MVASFHYRWRKIGWRDKDIEIGQASPEANEKEVKISVIIQLLFWPNPCAVQVSVRDLKAFSLCTH